MGVPVFETFAYPKGLYIGSGYLGRLGFGEPGNDPQDLACTRLDGLLKSRDAQRAPPGSHLLRPSPQNKPIRRASVVSPPTFGCQTSRPCLFFVDWTRDDT